MAKCFKYGNKNTYALLDDSSKLYQNSFFSTEIFGFLFNPNKEKKKLFARMMNLH